MIDFLIKNAATVIICIILALAVFGAVYKMIKDRKKGCSGGCENCPHNCKK